MPEHDTMKRGSAMTVTTTPSIEGKKISEYLGPVHGEAIIGANIVKDFTAGVRDIVGGRSGGYQKAREDALEDLYAEAEAHGADAVVSLSFDYEELRGTMIWVNVTGTAVKVE